MFVHVYGLTDATKFWKSVSHKEMLFCQIEH